MRGRTRPPARIATLALVFVAATVAARRADAQAFSRLEAGQQAVTVETGLASGIVTSLGYAAGLRLGGVGTLIPFAQATLVVARPDLHDGALKAGAQAGLLHAGWFDLSARLALEVASTENSIYDGTAFRTDLTLYAGHYGRRWFAVGEVGYDRTWLTYLKNSDFYRTYVYSGAQDGWYAGTGGVLRGGAKGGLTISRVELVLEAGVNKTETLQDLDLPFYTTLGANYRF